MPDQPDGVSRLAAVAESVRHVRQGADDDGPAFGRAAVLRRPHEAFCREVADHYERAPRLSWTPPVSEHYRRYVRENLAQYRALRAAGVVVLPWTRPGQPYRDSRRLIDEVRRTGVLFVYPTRAGHGPDDADVFHPLRVASGVVENGMELAHNDVLRAVHDLFGHVLHGFGFGPRGELSAAYAHARLYSPPARLALFTEHVGQICWYFYGPHSSPRSSPHSSGGPGGDGSPRPYPPQKVFLFPQRFLADFVGLFEPAPPDRSVV